MKGEWCYWFGYLSKEKCERIVQSALELPPQNPTIGYSSNNADDSYRRSAVRFLDQSDQRFSWIFDEYWKMLISFNKDWFGFNVTHLPPLQFTEYDASYKGEYQMHQDVFWINPTSNHRKITVVVQLTDPSEYEGGELVMHYVDNPLPQNEIKTQGTFIAFPSFYYHQLTPVTKGTRHSLVGWFEGPKFQ